MRDIWRKRYARFDCGGFIDHELFSLQIEEYMIKLFLCDVDGTLTDGIYHTTEKGEISKNFFTRDFHGLWMLDETEVRVGIITASNDDVIDHQCRRGAKYVDVMKKAKDKLVAVRDNYVDKFGYDWDEIAFIGDDVFDIRLLSAVGLCACPFDADSKVIEFVEQRDEGFYSNYSGGYGCVREFAEYVLEINAAGESNE